MKKIINYLSYAVILLGIAYIGLAVISPKTHESITSYTKLVVVSDSMEPTLKPFDFIVSGSRDSSEYAVGDIISFKHDINDDGNKNIITHKIAEIKNEDSLKFITKGENQDRVDNWIIDESDVLGSLVLKFPYFGLVILGMQKVAMPILVLSFSIIVLLIIITLRKYYGFR